MNEQNRELIAKKGRPPSGRGAYFRIYLDKELTAKFDRLCKEKDFSRSELLRVIVTSWMDDA